MASELELLRSFLSVYRAGSITRAAPTLNLTQPAVSGHVRDLERRVGRRLFTRTPRGTTPTQAAHDLARRVAPHIDALSVLLMTTGPDDPVAGGTVYVGGPAEFLGARVLPTLALMAERDVRLRVTHGLPAGLIEALASGQLDIVVATRRVEHRAVEYEPLYRETFVLVGAPRWMAAASRGRRSGIDREAIVAMPLVAYSDELPVTERFYREALNLPVPEPAVLVPDLRSVAAIAIGGAGIAALPRYLCEDALRRGELVELVRPATPITSQIFLAWRSGTSSAPTHAALHLLRGAATQW